MAEIARITNVQPILFGVLKVRWDDDYENIVDVRPYLEEAPAARFINDTPSLFDGVEVGEFGHGLEWTGPQNSELMMGTASLRKQAERQAALHKLAS